VEKLKAFCQERHLSVTQVALAWVLAQPTVMSAIVGISKPEQLDQTIPAIDLMLDKQILDVCNGVWYQLPRERNRDVAFR